MSATSTRRRVLAAATAVSFGTVASAAASAQREDTMPRDQVAARDPDAELQQLHDAIVAQEAEVERLRAAWDAMPFPDYPEWPVDERRKVAEAAGLDFEVYATMDSAEFQLHCNSLPDEVYDRVWLAQEACKAAYDRVRSERAKVRNESVLEARRDEAEAAMEEAEGRLTDLRDEMASIKAVTPRGVLFKLRAAVAMELGRECLEDTGFDYSNPVMFSVIDDMEAIAGGDHVA